MIINHQLDDYPNSDQELHKPSKPSRAAAGGTLLALATEFLSASDWPM